jgi:hypothetical protein
MTSQVAVKEKSNVYITKESVGYLYSIGIGIICCDYLLLSKK